MKGVHVKWSVLRWAEGQSFILCDPRCKLLYSQGRERVNRSIVHCWITCKCCNYMYICLIFFCTLSSFLFLLLFCVVILFIFGSVLCSKCFCLPWFTIMIHSTASVQSAFVSFIWFCLYLLHSEKGAITWLFFNSKHQYWIWYRPLLWSTEGVTEDSKPIVLLTKCMSIIIMNLVLSI